MNNDELRQILQQAGPLHPPAGYWEDFPDQVAFRLARGDPDKARAASAPSRPRWVWAAAFAAAAIVAAILVFPAARKPAPLSPGQVAGMREYLRQVETLFPNQVRAIIFDSNGPRLLLADKPDVPGLSALLLNVCGAGGCQRIITFSGQQVTVNGDLCDVLLDGRENILLVGRRTLWSAGQTGAAPSGWNINAQRLEL
jgi:hypothetical protein